MSVQADDYYKDYYAGYEAYDKGQYLAALELWKSAAEQGVMEAQASLAEMYRDGLGVIQDYVIAYMWVNLAIANNGVHDSNIRCRDNLAKIMTPSQIAEAQKLSRECLKKEYKNCY